MLDSETKKHIDSARQILVGKIPDPKAQVEQITTTLIYKFMDDMDREAEEIGRKAGFLVDELEAFQWGKLMSRELSGMERLDLYIRALQSFAKSKKIPEVFRHIFKDAFLPYRDPETLSLFLKEIDWFSYDNSENLGNAFEYLLSILGSQGDAGQFRTPRHIIDFITEVVDPAKNEKILDPACGTAGFLISAYKHIQHKNSSNYQDKGYTPTFAREDQKDVFMTEIQSNGKYNGDLLTTDDRKRLANNIYGYDISPDMVRLSLVNLYLHNFISQNIEEYDTLTSDDKWDQNFDVILANPPFMSPKGGIRPHKGFQIQANRAEVLFVDYIAEHLTINGRAGIIVPEGIIFQSSGAYKDLRKMLVDDGYLSAVVSLPSGVFQPYSGVKTSILFFDRQAARASDEVCFIKVENDGFDLGAQRRRIKANDLPEAYAALRAWRSGEKIESKNVSYVKKSEIAASGDYNLTGERYREAVDYSNAKWEVKSIGELIDTITPPAKISKSEYLERGRYPIIDQSQNEITGWTNEEASIIHPQKPLVIFGDHTCSIKYMEEPFSQGADGIKIIRTFDALLPKFLYFLLLYDSIESDGYKRHFTKLKRHKIPLPPLEIQEQIIEELEGYQAVIEGARKIVENWKPAIKIKPEWEMVELGEVCDTFGGGTPSRQDESFWGGDIPWITSKYFGDDHRIKGFENISEKGLQKSSSKLAPEGSTILITRVSVGKFAFADRDYAINQDLTALVSKNSKILDPKFLFLCTAVFAESVQKNAVGIGVTGVTRDFVNKLKIPLPPLEEQRKLVESSEMEQRTVDAAKDLLNKHEMKIEERISELWGNE